jgi:hypothetical protein
MDTQESLRFVHLRQVKDPLHEAQTAGLHLIQETGWEQVPQVVLVVVVLMEILIEDPISTTRALAQSSAVNSTSLRPFWVVRLSASVLSLANKKTVEYGPIVSKMYRYIMSN